MIDPVEMEKIGGSQESVYNIDTRIVLFHCCQIVWLKRSEKSRYYKRMATEGNDVNYL